MGCSCDPVLTPPSLSLPAALSSHLNELTAILTIVVQHLRLCYMEPFMFGSAVLAVVKLYWLRHKTLLGVIVNMAFAWT